MDANEISQMQQMQKIEETKRQVLSKMLSKEAYERLARIRAVNQELAGQVDLYLLQIFQSGKLKDAVSDSQLKEVLKYLSSSEQRKTTIKRV